MTRTSSRFASQILAKEYPILSTVSISSRNLVTYLDANAMKPPSGFCLPLLQKGPDGSYSTQHQEGTPSGDYVKFPMNWKTGENSAYSQVAEG
jgi:hypothetical protein